MRIGIVNDMPMARETLRRVVRSVPDHQIAWLAADGEEAVAEARRDRPDLILMDLVMPGLDGAEATRRIMAESPCPILVVTATVSGNFGKVYDAMGHGALDAVDTPTLGLRGELSGGDRLLAKIATVGKLTGKGVLRVPESPAPRRSQPRVEEAIVAIGASTGGPNALAEVLSAFPQGWPTAVVMVQHVDAAFAPGLARWLGERSGHRVEVIEEGDRPEPGRFLLAATNDHLMLGEGLRLRYDDEPRAHCFRPSVDVFFASLAALWPTPGAAALLTGMGRDGAAGLLALRRAGWLTVAQDEATSIVWGMPRAAVELDAADRVLPISAVGAAVVNHLLNRLRNDEGPR